MITETTRQEFEQHVLSRLRRLGLRLRAYVLLNGLSAVSVAGLVATLVTLVLDYTFRLDWDMRLVQLATLVAVIAVIAWRRLYQPLRFPIRKQDLAVLVEHRYPELRSRLISAVEFVDPEAAGFSKHPSRSAALANAVVRQAQAAVTNLRFNDTLAHRRARQRAGIILGCIAIVLLLTLLSAETMGLWFERNVLLRNVDWPQRNRLIVEGLTDGRMIAPRGEDRVVSAVVAHGYEPPRQAYIHYESVSGVRARQQMPAVRRDRVRFNHTFERIIEPLRCRISGGDAETETFTIDIVDRPRIGDVTLHVAPPVYTRMEGYDLRPGQTVAETLQGSEISFRIVTSKPVRQATLIRRSEGKTEEVAQAQRLADRTFAVQDRPPASATYHFNLTDALGLSNRSERVPPVRMSVRLVADKPPKVMMDVKDAGGMITAEAVLPIETEFADTYGLATADLVVEVTRENADTRRMIEPMSGFTAGAKRFTHAFDFSVSAHELAEGDRVTLHAEASDFDNVAGPNIGKSISVTLRIVSREELLAELNRREQEYGHDFERFVRQQEGLFANLLSAIDESDAATDPQQRARNLSQLAHRQRDHAGRMNLLRRQFDQVLAELRINQLSSPSIETRLGGGIAEPIGQVGQQDMPKAAAELDKLARQFTPQAQASARAAQEAVITQMNRILANLVQWEGYYEAVNLLREVIKMQGEVREETETRLERELFGSEEDLKNQKPQMDNDERR